MELDPDTVKSALLELRVKELEDELAKALAELDRIKAQSQDGYGVPTEGASTRTRGSKKDGPR
jgi:hypothetical protein